MRLRSRSDLRRVLLAALLLPGVQAAIAQTSGSVFGFVRSTSGAALPDISLALSQSGSSAAPLHTTTDALGAFHFDHLAMGTYQLSANRPGDAIAPDGPIMLSMQAATVQRDVTLSSAGGSAQKPPGLQLQAAGIRGYIDPGGYSAPAGAAAATNLIKGAADLNRSNDSAAQTAVDCSRGDALLKAAQEHPDSAAANRQLGQYYLAAQQPEKALPYLQHAWIAGNHDPETLVPLAEALLQNRQFQAAQDLLSAQVSSTNTTVIHRLLARADEGLGAFRQASLEYQAAAALEPSEADFYGAGYELILAGSAGDAAKMFESGTARYPESTTLLMGIGTAEFLQGQSAEATRIFLHCVTLHPDDARLYPSLAASFAISGTDADAVEASFRRYYELSTQSADAAYFYAMSLLHAGTAKPNSAPNEAEGLFKRAIQLDPGFAKAHLQLGSLYFDRGDSNHAAEEFATALRLDPGLEEAHYKLSLAYKRSGQTELADQQMQLFLAKKNQKTGADQVPEVPIEEFLSVFARPVPKPGAAIPCASQK